MRYMPTFCLPLCGSLVKTSGSVTNGPPSSGQVVSTGSRVRSGVALDDLLHGGVLDGARHREWPSDRESAAAF